MGYSFHRQNISDDLDACLRSNNDCVILRDILVDKHCTYLVGKKCGVSNAFCKNIFSPDYCFDITILCQPLKK